jgi:hypothetical protein
LTIKLLTSLAFFAALGACSPGGAEPSGRDEARAVEGGNASFDVNDVSFLFPVVDAQGVARPDDLLSIQAPGKGGPLLSEEHLAAAVALVPDTSLAHPRSPVPSAGAGWKVVGARVDDCAKFKVADEQCTPQLRLVAQPNGTDDHALHLIYNLAPAELDAVVAELVALKASSSVPTNGAPLYVHPAMRAEGAAGPFATRLKQLITAHAGPENLFAVATMFTVGRGETLEWRFANLVPRDGTLVSAPAPCVVEPNAGVTFEKTIGTPMNRISPALTCQDDLDDLLFTTDERLPFFKLTPEEQQAAIDGQLRADNPDLRAFQEQGCPTCHNGTHALQRVRGTAFVEGGFDQNPNRFVAAPGVTTAYRSHTSDPAERDDAVRLNDFMWDVRAFGYNVTRPSFTMRVVNESARVADSLNRRLAAKPAP